MCVQSIVEKPSLYISGRCPSNDQQPLYSDIRLEDISLLRENLEISDGIPIRDKMRIFKGDSPARQFEAGQQKGGTFFCCSCSIQRNFSAKLRYTLQSNCLSLQERINKVTQTESTLQRIRRGDVKLFYNLKKDEIIDELHQRKVKFSCNLNGKDLLTMLEYAMHGIQRLPAILYKSSEPFNMRNYNIPDYEILTCEPLHDTCNHTKNLYDELPRHLPKNEKTKLNNIITISFHLKEAKNSSDYRKSLLIVTNWLIQNLPEHYITKIFSTFAEIQEITYAVEEKRSCLKILRLSNLTFTHALLLFIHIKDNLKSLTSRKLFGVYYHSIVKHAPIQFRLFSGRMANTEKEEAMFTAMKRDTNNSSNIHPDNVMKNIII